MEMIKSLDWSPLWISLKTAVVTTIICFFLGIFLARKVMKLHSPWDNFLDGLLTLPMVLPPTVAGFFLLLLFSKRRAFGSFLFEHFCINVVQSFLGCVMYRNARSAFSLVPKDLVYAGQTLGMSEFSIFWKIIVPLSAPGIFSGTVLSFARALGEYGATSMLAGNIPGKTATISQRIALVMQDQDYATAGFWVMIVLLLSFGILTLYQFATEEKQFRT